MVQLVGTTCTICQRTIGSILDGTFCADCGNPFHHRCQQQVVPASPDRCPRCGGDPASAMAVRVREEWAREARLSASQGPRSPHPVGKVCPSCGHPGFRKRRPEGFIAFTWDRVCTACQTRYTPPTPAWAAVIFIIAGLILTPLGVFSLFVRLLQGNVLGLGMVSLLIEGFFALLGVLAIFHGVRSLLKPGKT